VSEIFEKYGAHVAEWSFPYINTEHEYRDIRVVSRGRLGEDSWAIVHMGDCYQPKGGRWAYERSNSSRTDKFLKASRMPLEVALPLADRLAKSAAKEWQKRLARMIARQEAAQAAKAAQSAQEGL
jgi:hypothetical protein